MVAALEQRRHLSPPRCPQAWLQLQAKPAPATHSLPAALEPPRATATHPTEWSDAQGPRQKVDTVYTTERPQSHPWALSSGGPLTPCPAELGRSGPRGNGLCQHTQGTPGPQSPVPWRPRLGAEGQTSWAGFRDDRERGPCQRGDNGKAGSKTYTWVAGVAAGRGLSHRLDGGATRPGQPGPGKRRS